MEVLEQVAQGPFCPRLLTSPLSLVPRPHPLREKGPGIHCLRTRLISQHFTAPAYHRDVRSTMTSIRIRGRIINRVRDNGYSCGRLGSFDFLRPPAPSMCSEGTETRAENVFEVHIRGEGRFRLFLWIYA